MVTEQEISYEDQYRQAAGRVFRRLRAERGWSLREFGERAQTSHTSLYSVERGEGTPGIDVLGRVAAAFGLDLGSMLALIIDELDAEGDTLSSTIIELSRLTPEQQDEVLSFIEYLKYRESRRRS